MRNKDNFNYPESWGDITIKQLNEIQSIQTNDIRAIVELIKIFNPDKDPLTLDLSTLAEMGTEIFEIITKTPTPTETDKYIIDGISYKVATPETIDFQQYIDVVGLNFQQENELKNLPLIISVLTENRPETTDVKQWADMVSENVPVSVALGIVLFFSNALENFIKNSPQYFKITEIMKKNEKTAKTL